jgi:hypothetical protein
MNNVGKDGLRLGDFSKLSESHGVSQRKERPFLFLCHRLREVIRWIIRLAEEQILILTLPLISCVTLGELLCFSGPWFCMCSRGCGLDFL